MTPMRLARYLWKETVPLYAAGFAVFILLMTTDLISSVAGVVLQNHPSLADTWGLYWYRFPIFFSQASILAVPFAVLLALGRLANDSELKAIFSAGIRPIRLLAPFLLLGVLVSSLVMVNENIWKPQSNIKWDEVAYRVWYNAKPPRNENLYTRLENNTLYYAGSIAQIDDHSASLQGAMVRNSQATYSAQSGIWNSKSKTWTLYSVWEYQQASTPPVFHPSLEFPYQAPFQAFSAPAAQQSLSELQASLRDPQIDPLKARQNRFEIARRLADPLAGVAFAFAAATLGLLIRNRSWAFAAVILMIFVYYVLWSSVPELIKVDALAPLLAAWIPNAALMLLGIACTRKLA